MMRKIKQSYHRTILTGSFLGIIWLSHGSMSGNCSNSWFLMPLMTDVFSWMQFDTFSFSSNLKEKLQGTYEMLWKLVELELKTTVYSDRSGAFIYFFLNKYSVILGLLFFISVDKQLLLFHFKYFI